MLSFDTPHAVAGCQIDTAAQAETLGRGRPRVSFIVAEQPCTAAGHNRRPRASLLAGNPA